ncbi:prepilin-type cleavage/methylation domain-containing protein [Lactobacillus sp. CBA3606]|uniref:competence type IV pilus major pilin ComGC n=1 Tax=Lactobacillus sp. CBA3606 TaxID=2099789 RepID=UPI000CFB5E9F|nr:competence type IV pilus major pilin ComGC [Lactobacillus sp. CBA3606]AVK63304.1 prepilin-type cleavage/methylation domain-containing protein [Lactobacillus sp. CBA3606]
MKTVKQFWHKVSAPHRGFTLIEMVIVLSIIALLMLIVVPNLNAQRKTAGDRQNKALTEVVQNQAEMYANDMNKDITTVNIQELQTAKYLNSQQAKQALDQKIDPVRPENKNAKTT